MSGLIVDIRAKDFAGNPVLSDILFDIPAGERVALLGPSGIGKSTLLGLIAGIDTAFQGEIRRPEGRIAMVYQTPRLLPWRTLAQNIALIPGAGGEARARELLASVGLADAADQHPQKVSLGMQRRAALARAMAVQPALVLMDEPLVSLDPDSTRAMRLLLMDALDRSAASALIATHNRKEALLLADRIIELGGSPGTLASDRQSPLDRAARRDPAQIDLLQADWFGDDG